MRLNAIQRRLRLQLLWVAGESGVEGQVVVNQADAIGTEYRYIVCTGKRKTFSFEHRALWTCLAEAGRYEHGGMKASLRARFKYAVNCNGRDYKHSQINRIGDVREVSLYGLAEEFAAFLTDEVDCAREFAGHEIARHAIADLFRRGGDADDNYATRSIEG